MNYRMTAGDRVALTDDMIARIVQMVKAGNYMTIACAAVGVHRSAYNSWKNRAERVATRLEQTEQEVDPDEYPADLLPANVEPYEWQCYKLFWELETAEAESEATAVLLIRQQMPQQWTAAMTYLERRFPDRWRKRQTFEQVQIDGSSIDERAVIQDPEAMKLMHDAIERIQSGGELPPADDATIDEVPKLDQARLLGEGKEKDPR